MVPRRGKPGCLVICHRIISPTTDLAVPASRPHFGRRFRIVQTPVFRRIRDPALNRPRNALHKVVWWSLRPLQFARRGQQVRGASAH